MSITILSKDNLDRESLIECATLFSNHYGVWGKHAPSPLVFGTRVRMTPEKMWATLLFDSSCGVGMYRSDLDRSLLGHAFFCEFTFEESRYLWITQLVMHSGYQGQRVITLLIDHLLSVRKPDAVGIVTSHPVSLHVVQSCTSGMADRSLIERLHPHIPVPYIRESRLVNDRIIDTQFYVRHDDETSKDLPEGCEYIVVYGRDLAGKNIPLKFIGSEDT